MIGWASDVIMRTLLRVKRMSSRFQIMRTARMSSLMELPTSRTPMTLDGAALMAYRPKSSRLRRRLVPERRRRAALATVRSSTTPGAHPRVGPVAFGARGLGVADGAARVGHEHVIEGGPGHVHGADGDVGVGEQAGDELLAVGDEEGDGSLGHGGLQV